MNAMLVKSGFFLLALWFVAMPARAQVPAKPDDRSVEEAYVYLLGRVLVIRQEHIADTGCLN